VDSFSLARDVRAAQKRPRAGQRDLTVAPLQVMSGFGGGGKPEDQPTHRLLEAEMLRGAFPAVDVTSFSQEDCRRTVLFHCDKEKDTVEFRHFSVARRPLGLQKSVQKLLRLSRLPKMGKREDIADYLLNGGDASESEAEDGEEAPGGRGGGKSAVRLTESGPRMTLLLVKAEEGVCSGSVMYHRYKTKTPSQRELLEQKAQTKKKLFERAKKIEATAQGTKKAKLLKEKAKQALAVKKGKGGGDADGGGEEDEGEGGRGPVLEEGFVGIEQAKSGAADGKKKRFHPFGYGAKAARKAAQGKEKTVEMDDRPGKKPRRERGDGGGGPATTAKAAQKRGQSAKPTVLDKFRQSAKPR